MVLDGCVPSRGARRSSLRQLISRVGQDLPSNLLDDVADESGALAQVTLGAGDTGLDDAGGGFLQFWNRPIISFKVHHPRLPRERRAAQRSSTR